MILLVFSLVLVVLAISVYAICAKKESVSDPFLYYKNIQVINRAEVKGAVRPMLGMIETEETLQKKREYLSKKKHIC